jgi:HEAT repeat protein
VLIVGATALGVRHRQHRRRAPTEAEGGGEARHELRAPADAWRGFEAGVDVPARGAGGATAAPPRPDPFSKEVTPDQVADAMAAWRQGILEKRAEQVLALDQAFAALPGRYGPALVHLAATDPNERVRAFSTRVLGKMKNVALVETYQQLLADGSPFVRQNAAWALGELAARPGGRAAAEAAGDELRQAADADPATEVRAAATNALKALQ